MSEFLKAFEQGAFDPVFREMKSNGANMIKAVVSDPDQGAEAAVIFVYGPETQDILNAVQGVLDSADEKQTILSEATALPVDPLL